jgi:hypothetical protein
MLVLQTKDSATGIFNATFEATSVRPEWFHSFQVYFTGHTKFTDSVIKIWQLLHKTVHKTFVYSGWQCRLCGHASGSSGWRGVAIQNASIPGSNVTEEGREPK